MVFVYLFGNYTQINSVKDNILHHISFVLKFNFLIVSIKNNPITRDEFCPVSFLFYITEFKIKVKNIMQTITIILIELAAE